MKHYFNTTAVTGPDLFDYEAKAQSQDEKALEFIQMLSQKTFTCEDIHNFVMPEAPLTSARRSVSNLYKEGLIEKVGTAHGSYHRPIILWRLK